MISILQFECLINFNNQITLYNLFSNSLNFHKIFDNKNPIILYFLIKLEKNLKTYISDSVWNVMQNRGQESTRPNTYPHPKPNVPPEENEETWKKWSKPGLHSCPKMTKSSIIS